MIQISEHCWIYPYEETRDRPTLSYIRGRRIAIAIDAGHSASHVHAFYQSLEESDLSLPDLTVLTHWHWDHTFGMHAVHGLTIAEKRTQSMLKQMASQMSPAFQKELMQKDEHIVLEYQDQSMHAVPADLIFEQAMEIDAGDCTLQLLHVPSPHTDDCIVILLKEDGLLFIGDASSGPWPSYEIKDVNKLHALKEALQPLAFQTVIGGHWPIESRNDFFNQRLAVNMHVL